MSKVSASRRAISASSAPHQLPLSSDDLLYLSSTDWTDGLNLASPYASSVPLSLAPTSQSTLHLTPLTPHSQPSQHHMFADMPVPTFENGHYMTVNSQLPWSADSLMVPSLHHDISSQGSSPEDRYLSESPSFQDGDGEAETPSAATTGEPKKPKRSRPNRYKNAPPAVIQRRRAANRKSQQAYRKRKDDRIAELEELLGEAAKREQQLGLAYMTLRTEYEQLLMVGSPSSSSQQGRSPSITSAACAPGATTTAAGITTTAITSEEEEAASTFMAMAGFGQHDGNHHQHIAPELSHPQHAQQSASSPNMLSIYPPPPM